MGLPFTDNVKIINAVTTVGTTASAGVDVSQRQLRSIQFLATSFTSGTITFRVDVTNDTANDLTTNWVQYNRLTDNLTNTNAQNDTRVALFSTNANTSKIYFFPAGDYFKQIRVRVGIVTDGTATATLQAAG